MIRHSALYITSTGPLTGKGAIALGTMQALAAQMPSMAVYRPIINAPQNRGGDATLRLLLDHFRLNQAYDEAYAYTSAEAREIINRGARTVLLENIIQKFKRLMSTHDFICCIGTDLLGKDPVFEFELNAEIASTLGVPVILVSSGDGQSPASIEESLRVTLHSLAAHDLDVLAIFVNRASLSHESLASLRGELKGWADDVPLFALPDEPALGRATLADVARGLPAEVLFGADRLDTPVGEYLVASMHVDNFLRHLARDQLVVAAGDRSDILLAALGSRLSPGCPDIAGVLLTGGIKPHSPILRLVAGFSESPLPILLAKTHTYPTITALQEIYGLIEPGDTRRIDSVLALYERHVDTKKLIDRLTRERPAVRTTPMMFEFELIERARSKPMRIVLAEGEDERILKASAILLRREVARIILLGDEEKIRNKAAELSLDIEKATIINPLTSPKFGDYVQTYYELRKSKGMTLEKARQTMTDSTYFGTMMVELNDADGMVSGAVNTTAHTIRPALEFIKTRPGFSVVSSVFLMCMRDRVLVFGDCAVNPNPTAQQLAEIAIASAHTAKVFGIVPRVAMLSYSTGTSGKGEDVDVVAEATRIAHELAPDLDLEGPLQYDAAIDPVVAATKMPDSNVAGRATVFIFPDLNTGNNTYKAVQRAAHAIAIGPVLQGLKKPVNDLSRGCTVPDIVNTVAITAVQAAADKKAAGES